MVKEVGLANATILGFCGSLTDDTALRAQVSTTHRDGTANLPLYHIHLCMYVRSEPLCTGQRSACSPLMTL